MLFLGRSSYLFRFNLQQVLNFRRQHEERKEFELAQAQRVLQQEEDRLAFFIKRQDHCQRELLDRQKEGISPAEVRIYTTYMGFVKERIDWQIEAVNTAKRHVEEKKEALLAARRDRKTLDRLRSRRYQAFLVDSRRKEMKHLDDVALGRFRGRTRERRD